jgi:hypothetical protein
MQQHRTRYTLRRPRYAARCCTKLHNAARRSTMLHDATRRSRVLRKASPRSAALRCAALRCSTCVAVARWRAMHCGGDAAARFQPARRRLELASQSAALLRLAWRRCRTDEIPARCSAVRRDTAAHLRSAPPIYAAMLWHCCAMICGAALPPATLDRSSLAGDVTRRSCSRHV